MIFSLIDRIDRLEPERSIVARKLTSHLEEHWQHGARGMEMPVPLVLETLCQAGCWLIVGSTELRSRAVLVSVDDVSFFGPVLPGDVLIARGTVESLSAERAVMSGTVSVNDRVVLRADTILCALRPTAELDSPENLRRDYDRLMRGAEVGVS